MLASSTRLAARTAASVGKSPAAPTIAAMTICTFSPVTATAERFETGLDPRLRSETLECRPRLAGGLRIDQHDDIGLEAQRLFDDRLPAAVGPQHRHAKAVRMQADDRKRAAPDAAGGAQNGDAADGRSFDDPGAE